MSRKQGKPLDWAEFMALLPVDEREVVLKASAMVKPVAKNKTEGTFIEGDAILFIYQHVQKRTFSLWCKKEEFDRSAAYKRMQAVGNLAPIRSRIIAAGVQPTVLLVLGAHPDRAEEIVSLYEAGQRPNVREVNDRLGIGVAGDARDAGEIGGPKGIKRLHDGKRNHINELTAVLESIIAAIDSALSADRLVKSHLVEQVLKDARWARLSLLNLGAYIEPVDLNYGKTRPVPFPEGSRWHKVEKLLFALGGSDTWPSIEALEPWLRKALPLLKWAARGEGAGVNKDGEATAQTVESEPSAAAASGTEFSEGDENYLLPLHFAFDGERYEVSSDHAPGWHEAAFQDGIWMSEVGEIHPLLVKLHRALKTEGIRLVGEEYPSHVRLNERQEWRETLARNIAAFLIFGEEFPFGSAPAEEPVIRIAAALLRDFEAGICGNVSTHDGPDTG
jgi:hypothetical protein